MKTTRTFLVLSLAVMAVFALVTTARADTIAYDQPMVKAGNQNWSGPLGMDFDVVNPGGILVTALGVFDDHANGVAGTLVAYIYDRDTASSLQSLAFTRSDPGTLSGSNRFKTLEDGLFLPAGFHGSIVAEGFGNDQANWNVTLGHPAGEFGPTLNDGGGAISFVQDCRWGNAGTSGLYPTLTCSAGGYPLNANTFDAGTFKYDVVPEPATLSLLGLGLSGIARAARRRRK